jgi:MFS transporter, ACDE family, multidrug resistance protein
VQTPGKTLSDQPAVPLNANLLIIFGMTLTVVLGVSSITPAFPGIMHELHLTKSQVGLLITFYSLPGIFFALLMGVGADRFGRKIILVPCMLLYGIAGGACAFTRDFNLLLVLRFLQGLGATAAGTLSVAIIGDIYSGKSRTIAMSYNIGVLNAGTMSFPIIGGGLAMFGWHYPFLLPLAAIPLGFAMIYGLNYPEPQNHQDFHEYLRSALESIRNRKAIALFLVTLITFIILYGAYITYFPVLLDERFGASSIIIGLIMAVTSVSTVITASRITWFVRRFSEKKLMVFGFVCYAVAMTGIAFVPALWVFIIPTIIYGFGAGINMPSSQSILVGLAPDQSRAVFLSINSMVLRLGQTLGPFLMGIIITFWGMNAVFLAGAVCAIAMMAVTVVLLK